MKITIFICMLIVLGSNARHKGQHRSGQKESKYIFDTGGLTKEDLDIPPNPDDEFMDDDDDEDDVDMGELNQLLGNDGDSGKGVNKRSPSVDLEHDILPAKRNVRFADNKWKNMGDSDSKSDESDYESDDGDSSDSRSDVSDSDDNDRKPKKKHDKMTAVMDNISPLTDIEDDVMPVDLNLESSNDDRDEMEDLELDDDDNSDENDDDSDETNTFTTTTPEPPKTTTTPTTTTTTPPKTTTRTRPTNTPIFDLEHGIIPSEFQLKSNEKNKLLRGDELKGGIKPAARGVRDTGGDTILSNIDLEHDIIPPELELKPYEKFNKLRDDELNGGLKPPTRGVRDVGNDKTGTDADNKGDISSDIDLEHDIIPAEFKSDKTFNKLRDVKGGTKPAEHRRHRHRYREQEGICTFTTNSTREALDLVASVVFTENVFKLEVHSPFEVLVPRRPRRGGNRRPGGGGRRPGGSTGRRPGSRRGQREKRQGPVLTKPNENKLMEFRRRPRPNRKFWMCNMEQLTNGTYNMRFIFWYRKNRVPSYTCNVGCTELAPATTAATTTGSTTTQTTTSTTTTPITTTQTTTSTTTTPITTTQTTTSTTTTQPTSSTEEGRPPISK